MRHFQPMAEQAPLTESPQRPLPRWEDLEAFLAIAAGVEAGRTIMQVGEDGTHGYGGPRLLYLRLARLEEALGVRLVERRKWSRNVHLTEEGTWLAAELRRQRTARMNLQKHFADRSAPTLRLSATSTMISTFLPAVVQAMKRRPDLKDLRLTLIDREREEDVLQDVHDNRAAVGLALQHGHAHVPHDVRVESLATSPRAVLCHESHPFVTRARHDPSRAAVQHGEIAHERVFIRPHDARYLPPPSSLGEHFVVPRFEEARAYVRAGLGVTISLEILERLLGPDEHLQALPLEPTARVPLSLIAPRKREGSLNGHLPAFLDVVREVARAAEAPALAERSLMLPQLPSPPYRPVDLAWQPSRTSPPQARPAAPARENHAEPSFQRVTVPAKRPPAAGTGTPFDPRRDLRASDWEGLAYSLQQFTEWQYWEDYVSLACYLHRLDAHRGVAIVRPPAAAWPGMEAILHHWRARENWHEFAWYAFALRLICHFCKRRCPDLTERDWEGMFGALKTLRARGEWYHFARHASRLVRLDPPRPPHISDAEWTQMTKVLAHFRDTEDWFNFAWMLRTLTILDGDRAAPLVARLTATEWRGMRAVLDVLRERTTDDPRRWFTFALHAYSLARIAGRSGDLPSPVLTGTEPRMRSAARAAAPVSAISAATQKNR